jgi:hypothetical protein
MWVAERYKLDSIEGVKVPTQPTTLSALTTRVALWLSDPSELNWLEGEMNWLAQGRVTL